MLRVDAGGSTSGFDQLAAEEPLEIRVSGTSLAVTMRTPGHDFELTAGFLVTEGLVQGGDEINRLRYCGTPDQPSQQHNVVAADLADPRRALAAASQRNFAMSSACGLCGKASIDSVRTRVRCDVGADPLRVTAALLTSLPARMRAAQRVFDRTGGLHAAGLFDPSGALLCLREDVGRHNAFDKVIGWAALAGRLPLRGHLMLASGRASFELTQKAVVAGVPLLAAVSAPSSLAVDLAEEAGMTLVGFLRGDTMNVYAGAQRVVPAPGG